MFSKISKFLSKQLNIFIQWSRPYMNRWWYSPLLGFLAAADFFLIVIPTDGLVISSSMIVPRRWFSLALFPAIGSTLGASIFAVIIQMHGLPWLTEHFPELIGSNTWVWADDFFQHYGLIFLFLIAASPLIQQPIVALSALSHIPIESIFWIVLIGRLIKFIIMSYISSHAPKLIGKMWGVQDELKQVRASSIEK